MIQAEELRSGNWVKIVTSTYEHEVKQEHWKCSGQTIYLIEEKDIEVEGIPITEEVLLKCGHVLCDGRSGSGYILVGNYDFEVNTYTSKVCTVRHPRSTHGIAFPCKYLHQLQNIVAITGQELTYTP